MWLSVRYTDIRPVYLVSFKAASNTGNITTLEITFNLSCDIYIQNEVTLIVDIIPLNNSVHSNASQTQRHNIMIDDDNEENLFRPWQVLLTFSDIMRGLEYTVQARLEGDIILPEFQMIISVPFGM